MTNDETAEAQRKKDEELKLGCGILIVVAIIIGLISANTGDGIGTSGGGSGGLSAPRRGSWADVMCDTNSVGDPGVVYRGGKWYDAECLGAFSWTELAE